jgi:hypothetical protein
MEVMAGSVTDLPIFLEGFHADTKYDVAQTRVFQTGEKFSPQAQRFGLQLEPAN